MNKNVFKKWAPVLNLPSEIYLEALYDDYEGFRLLLKGARSHDKILRISFDPVLAYRAIDEGDLISYDRVDYEENIGRWSFFTVGSSDYLGWFKHASQGMHEDVEINHYAIYTSNQCLDILSAYPPTVEWLD